MSALGQEQVPLGQVPMSALPLKAGIDSFDHLVTARPDRGAGRRASWHVESLSVGRIRHNLRTRHRVQWTDSRTSQLVGGRQCSDAKPCFDADQNQQSSGGAEQNDFAHWNAPLHSAHHSFRGEHSLVEFRGPDV